MKSYTDIIVPILGQLLQKRQNMKFKFKIQQYQTDVMAQIQEEYCKQTVRRILRCFDYPFMYTEKRTEDDNKRRNTRIAA